MRRLVLLLLSLLLLLSQQMTLAHTVAHWQPVAIGVDVAQTAATDSGDSTSDACPLCVAAAQFASALPASLPGLNPPAPGAAPPCTAPAPGIAGATTLAFHSRGPPAR